MDAAPPAIIQSGQELLPVLKQLENSGDNAINPKSLATGAFQITPGTGYSYGVKDPHDLLNPAVNEGVATRLANDLWKRYNGNITDVLTAWNAGTRLANRWIAGGRTAALPRETQGFLSRALPFFQTDGKPAALYPPHDTRHVEEYP